MTQVPLWKTIVLLFLVIVLLDAQSLSFIGSGSTVPLAPYTDDECRKDIRLLVADSGNLCWFYQCRVTDSGIYKLFPKRCALGTYVSPGFTVGLTNPCTQRFPIMDMYDCTRRSNKSEANCTKDLKCQNGGTPSQVDNYCWCACPSGWEGEKDCSKPKGPTPHPVGSVQCPYVDWCGQAMVNGKNPCQNGGTCINQCTNFYCSCPVPYTKTRYCEEFSCSTTDFKCPNTDDACTRGLNGKDEFFVCRDKILCADYLRQW